MEVAKLNKILDDHKLWLQTNGEHGKRANLSYVDLSSADLNNVDLSYADLNNANLGSANLTYANLTYAELIYANLNNANLNNVDLRYADLRYADLNSANLDFSAFPLWCGSLNVHINDRQAKQLLYHLVQNVQYSKNTSRTMKKLLLTETIIKKANEFHRVNECGKIVLELDKE